MKNPYFRLALLSVLLSAVCLATYPVRSRTAHSNSAMIMRDPDHFAWEVFCKISEPKTPGSNHPGWESWLSALRLYADPTHFNFADSGTPTAPRSKTGQFVAISKKTSMLMQAEINLPKVKTSNQAIGSGSAQPFLQREDVSLNPAAVRYIVDNGLISVERQGKMANHGNAIDFPKDAIEIKLIWRKFHKADTLRFQYYCQTDGLGNIWGLQGMHITTKDIPNWFWATFEHKDDYVIYNTPNKPLPFRPKDSWGYVNGHASEGLKALLKRRHLDANPWTNYRLTGSQADYTDSAGRPIFLGNNAIEGRVTTGDPSHESSCMTCHACSTVGARLGILMGPLRVGTPPWQWFYTRDAKYNYAPTNVQRDFVWSLSRAKHRYGPPEGVFWSIESQNPNAKQISFFYDIQPLFLERDIDYMNKWNIGLTALDDVHDNFDRIYAHYAHEKKPYMPLGRPKWSQYLLDEFKLWKTEGFKLVPDDPPPSPAPAAKKKPAG